MEGGAVRHAAPEESAVTVLGPFHRRDRVRREYSLAQKLLRAPKVIYSLEARKKLGILLDEVHPDICHAHNIYHHISPSILGLLKSRGIPTVLTLHDLKIACPAYNMLSHDGICERCKGGALHNVVQNRCIKGSLALSTLVYVEAVLHRALGSYTSSVTRFVVPSRFYIDKFCSWGMPREQFTHIPNFVDPDAFTPQGGVGKSFLFFGRLSREKGVATLIRAAASAGVPLKLAGTGPQQQELQALAASSGADVQFLGHLGGSALRDAVAGARAVVLPSEWYENAPMSVLESYGMGIPVIGADIGGIPELVRHETTGLVFTSADADSLAAALRRMSDLPDAQVAAMGSAGRDWIEKDFTAARYRERMLALYAELGVAGAGA